MIKHYFTNGNTSEGNVSLVGDVLETNKVYVIKGRIGKETTKLLEEMSKMYTKQNFLVQWLHHPSNEDRLDGIIVPEVGVAILSGASNNGLLSFYSGFVEEVFDFDDVLNKSTLEIHKKSILKLQGEIDVLHRNAYKKFADGRVVHEKKEKLYISAMDFEKANEVTAQLADQLFQNVNSTNEKVLVRQLFFGAATPNGAINFIDNITSDLNKRYIIKGRSGSGKSTLMRKIGKYATDLGLFVQYFPCGLDPNSLDMVIIPSLSVAILDGTAPHVIDATRQTDEIIDMFTLCMDKSIETQHFDEFNELQKQYKRIMKEGTQFLKEAKETSLRLEQLYEGAIQLSELERKRALLYNYFKA